MWVLGGRAREFVDLPEERSIGGIIGTLSDRVVIITL